MCSPNDQYYFVSSKNESRDLTTLASDLGKIVESRCSTNSGLMFTIVIFMSDFRIFDSAISLRSISTSWSTES